MKFGSLFSGVGGFDLGFEQSGLSCAWQVEIDKDCDRVLQKHWPEVKRYEDVSTVGKLESVDVICGGFPCQDLSVAGKRAGLAGERSGLWFEFLRIIGLNRPRWIVIENVPGLLSSDEGRDFAVILRGLVECGYYLAWRVLDAQFYGVAQRRRRVFIVGSLGDGSSAEILFESESVSWNPPTRGEAGEGATSATVGSLDSGGSGASTAHGGAWPGHTMQSAIAGHAIPVAATLKQRGRGACDEVMDNLQITHALRSEGADASEDGTGRGTPLVVDRLEHHRFHCLTCGCWFGVNDYESNTVTCPKCGETHISKITDVLDYAEAIDVRNLRMQPDGTSGTLQHKKSGGYSLNYQNPVCVRADNNGSNGWGVLEDGTTHSLGGAQDVIAFSSKDHGADAGEIAPTLRSQNFKDSHMNGGGQAAIAFGWNKSDSQTMRVDGEATDALQASSTSNPAIAFSAGQGSKARSLAESVEHTPPLKAADSGLNRVPSISNGFGVRRLTPRECERLQSFPDDFTRWDANGKEISDSARYRMLGNAVCVNVSRWIGKRLIESIV